MAGFLVWVALLVAVLVALFGCPVGDDVGFCEAGTSVWGQVSQEVDGA